MGSSRWSRPALSATMIGAIVTLLAFGCGSLVARDPALGLAGAAVVFLGGVALYDFALLPCLCVPATLVVYRLGGGSSSLSMSDFVLFVGTMCALLIARFGVDRNMRSLMWVFATYLGSVLPTVALNPYRANIIEVLHEALLLFGSLIVGWVIGRAGRLRVATGLYVVLCGALSVWALAESALTHFQAVNLPYGMQKNYIGDMLAFGVLLCYARPAWFGWRGHWVNWAMPLLLVGILASQARQAMISLAIGAVIVLFRSRHFGKRSKLILLALIPLVLLAGVVFAQQLHSTNRFNSTYQRLTWFGDSINIWHTSPWFGVGLRWWYTGRFANAFQPPNALFELLTSAGVSGVMGLLVLFIVAPALLWRLPPVYGTLAFVAVVMRIVQGQLDLFWVGAQGSIPWLLAGAALGALARADNVGTVAPLTASHAPVAETPVHADYVRVTPRSVRSPSQAASPVVARGVG